jgi:hypothetical protein
VKKLFLCHHSAHAASVFDLANELRLRGIPPWVAGDGGFMLGDDQEPQARRVIREECHGLLFYATPGAIERDFIGRVELDEACRRVYRERLRRLLPLSPKTRFMITTVTDGVSFADVAAASVRVLGRDLSRYAGVALGSGDPPLQRVDVAHDALRQRLRDVPPTGVLSLQFSTRAPMPDEPTDLLRVEAEAALDTHDDALAAWARVGRGLADVKDEISQTFGRPLLRVHGSRHLTGSFLLGATFRRSSGFSLLVRARDGDWGTSGALAPVTVTEDLQLGDAAACVVQISATDKDPTPAVDRYLAQEHLRPTVVRFHIHGGGGLNAAQGRFVAAHLRGRVIDLVRRGRPEVLLVFMSVPQALAVQLGHEWNGLPLTILHEFDGATYRPSSLWSTPTTVATATSTSVPVTSTASD